MTRRRDVDDAADPTEAEALRVVLEVAGTDPRRHAILRHAAAWLAEPSQRPAAVHTPEPDQEPQLRKSFHEYLVALCELPAVDAAQASWARNRAAHRPGTSRRCTCREAGWSDHVRLGDVVVPTTFVDFCRAPLKPNPHGAANTTGGEAARLPDPTASRAVLIGVGSSPGLADLPEAEASVRQLADRLRQVASGTTLLSGTHATREQVRHVVARAADEASDTLFLHFAGHGLAEPGTGRLYLATTDAAMPIAELRDLTVRTRARHTLVLLDACTTDRSTTVSWQPDRDGALYMITATDGQPALARNPVRDTGTTAFTGAVIAALTRGVAGAGPLLDVGTLYTAVDRILERDTLPKPRIRAWGHDAGRWAITHNRHPRADQPLRDVARGQVPPDILTRVANGDHQAWSTLVDRYGRLVWATVRAFQLTPDQTADAAQAVWLRLVENLDTVTADNLAGFLTATARDTALAMLRIHAVTYKTRDTAPPPRPGRGREPRAAATAAIAPLPPGLNPAARQLVGELRALKNEYNLSLSQLSASTGYSRATWARWFNGRQLIAPDALAAVAKRCGCDPAHLNRLLREANHDGPGPVRRCGGCIEV